MSAPNNSIPKVRIGPAGWSYSDWSGYAYPAKRPTGFHEATYLAEFFDTIEINSSFYNPIRPDHAQGWLTRVASNANFMFTAKMWQRFTHDPNPSVEDEKLVRAGFDALRDAKKLGAVLLQFPFSFHHTPETKIYFTSVLKRFADYPLTVEVRHSSWNVPEILALLRESHVAFCNIDQPVIGKSLEASAELTSSLGYIRLHGRRYDTWFSDDETVPSFERYNYLYSAEELRPWADRVAKLADDARDVYVITNNHYQGKAVVNALELISMLKKSKVKVPDPLREKYPQLEAIADERPRAPRLF